MSSKQNAEIIRCDNGCFAVAVDGEIVRTGFVSKGHGAMWAKRAGLYRAKNPPRRKPEIPDALADEQILKLPLAAKLTGCGYPRFRDEAKHGLWGELYQLGKNTFGLKLGNIKRGMAARQVHPK
jgi:hypothetical protein